MSKWHICEKCFKRTPLNMIGAELNGVYLCQDCVDKGFYLKVGVVVKKLKRNIPACAMQDSQCAEDVRSGLLPSCLRGAKHE